MAKKGFFKSTQLQSKKARTRESNLAQCGKCKLYENCLNPKMQPGGKGKVKILHVGQSPDEVEDKRNDQLVGPAGTFYSKTLKKVSGIDLEDCKKTNANICKPDNNKTPTNVQIKACRPNLKSIIKEFQPHVIIALGGEATYSLIGHKFSENIGGINKWRGFVIPDREYQAWVCPIFHPSYVTRDTSPEAAEKIFKEDLYDAVSMFNVDLPYYTKEDEENKIEILKHEREINAWLKDLVKSKSLTAFDYEASGLKPHNEKHKIKTCAISCNPDHAVAFPMYESANFLQLLEKYLASNEIKKIMANAKYERDWTNVKLNMELNGIFFDTMIAAHCLDNRPKITGVEFQDYVNFGIEPYDDKVKPYIKPKGMRGNDLNYIDECNLEDLLIYNGMDSMSEFRLGILQMNVLGIEFEHLYSGKNLKEIAPQYNKIKERGTKCN